MSEFGAHHTLDEEIEWYSSHLAMPAEAFPVDGFLSKADVRRCDDEFHEQLMLGPECIDPSTGLTGPWDLMQETSQPESYFRGNSLCCLRVPSFTGRTRVTYSDNGDFDVSDVLGSMLLESFERVRAALSSKGVEFSVEDASRFVFVLFSAEAEDAVKAIVREVREHVRVKQRPVTQAEADMLADSYLG